MLSSQEIIGRVFSQSNPEEARTIVSQFRRMHTDPKHVAWIYNKTKELFCGTESDDSLRDLFVAAVYQIYQPLSYLRRKEDGKASGKLPVGVREEIQSILGVNNPETVNSLKSYLESWMLPFANGVERPFKTKVMQIVEAFKPYSINADDSQYQLFA